MKSEKKQNYSIEDFSNAIRILSADAIEKAKSGHPGMPLGMADVMTVLAFDFLRFNPDDPQWFDRDRLVLSAGHGSMLLYSFFYLAGYKDFGIEEIKNFRQLHSKAAGHPEHELYRGIETTTGPLGQGFASAVGMAIAEKKYKAKLGEDICSHKIYAIVGDGCLMEGISYEAASIAGHLKLNNLIILFDDNGISIDGSTSLAVSEDHLATFAALGFDVWSIDGHDYQQIKSALAKAQNSDKPCFIACKTIIGKGADKKAGSEKSHGAPLGLSELEYLKSNISFSGEPFFIPDEIKNRWSNCWKFNEEEYNRWQQEYNKLSADNQQYLSRKSITSLPKVELPEQDEATRVSSGRVIAALLKADDKVICGSADLASSNNVKNTESRAITANDFGGNFIHYGVREASMAAIMNGLSLEGLTVLGGTFFVFSDYMRPAIRLSAIMGLPVIYVMTHDSIGVGEDGPTHQPVEQLASFRAMPNINVLRPADFAEVAECYDIALKSSSTPSILALTRQKVVKQRDYKHDRENLSARGAYVISEANNQDNIDIVIFASGSEVTIAANVKSVLEEKGISIRVVSVPCFELLQKQGKDYLGQLIGAARHKVAIEAASDFGWHQIIGNDGIFFGMNSFGASAPADQLYRHFKIDADYISSTLEKLMR